MDTDILDSGSTGEVESIKDLEKEAAVSVVRAVKMGIDLTKEGVVVNGAPFFMGDYESLLDLNEGGSMWHHQVGIISGSTVFSSTRDGWNRLDHYPYNDAARHHYHGIPQVTGFVDEETGEPIIQISQNSVSSISGRGFNDQVLSTEEGIVLLSNTGKLTFQDFDGETRDLTKGELRELEDIFKDAYQKLQETKTLFARNK